MDAPAAHPVASAPECLPRQSQPTRGRCLALHQATTLALETPLMPGRPFPQSCQWRVPVAQQDAAGRSFASWRSAATLRPG